MDLVNILYYLLKEKPRDHVTPEDDVLIKDLQSPYKEIDLKNFTMIAEGKRKEMWVLQKPLSGDAVEVQLTDTGIWT